MDSATIKQIIIRNGGVYNCLKWNLTLKKIRLQRTFTDLNLEMKTFMEACIFQRVQIR